MGSGGARAEGVDVADALQKIYAKFGIDLPTGNRDGTWRLPIPARFVVDRGHYCAVDADPDYTRRLEPARRWRYCAACSPGEAIAGDAARLHALARTATVASSIHGNFGGRPPEVEPRTPP